uniref:2-keto-4-pentenoate hydratase n=1 Tax=Candidatus Kentrum sp. FW TaxID=2126338 RepID=A0A450TXD1_9GAMM|nr:MAG: 2-keto-4-pentenoate hydratase [Candidatus Kentron sp. FW]
MPNTHPCTSSGPHDLIPTLPTRFGEKPKKLFPLIMLWFVTTTAIGGPKPNPAHLIIQAEASHRPIPVLSLRHPAMDLDMAYRIQRAYVREKSINETLIGFKAGLTSKKGQQKFGLDAPIAGVLLASGKLTGKTTVHKAAFRRPMVETEIGFIMDATLTQPLSEISILKKSIRAIVPVIELPDLGFSDMEHLTGLDIIAANACARQFIVGHPQPVDTIDPNKISILLSRDGHPINQGKGREALGDQWQAALWLVNTMITQGWTIQPGQILLTGALGKMLPGKPGNYMADYGHLGKIEFEIR